MGLINRILAKIGIKADSNIIVNGKCYTGSKVKVIIDDAEVYCGPGVNITIEGNADNVETVSGDVTVNSNVLGNVRTTSGDVDVKGDVYLYVQTVSGDVEAKSIIGNVKTVSGDICCT